MKKWQRSISHIRTHLCREHPPPGQSDISNHAFTLQHLEDAFPYAHCPLESFQSTFQALLLP
ncbi:MAG: hypothetical protein L3J39_00860 [Verrucomicrobiales bacterium]|nr:hypothetical protein [Verrucomicrobiales bacterium]